MGGTPMKTTGFELTIYIVAMICFLYTSLVLFLRRPPAQAEKDLLVMAITARLNSWCRKHQQSKSLKLFIVTAAIFLDSTLITCVVPIVPELIYDLEHPDSTLRSTDSTLKTISYQSECLNNSMLLSQAQTKHDDLMKESMQLGVLLASKSIVNLVMNPIIGMWTCKIGLSIPLFLGSVVFCVSTLLFAFANSYLMLLLARSLQGIGSALTNVAGMAMIAEVYSNKERVEAFGFLIGALAIGLTLGPVYGGLLYEFAGQSTAFVIMAGLGLVDGCLQLLILRPKVEPSQKESTSIWTLIMDPYILLTAGAIAIANTSLGILEPSLPIRLLDKMGASRWELGMIYVASLVGYMTASRTMTSLANRISQWKVSAIGLAFVGVFLITLNFANDLVQISLPTAGYGFAVGLVDISMMPLFSYLVDIRHTGVYGNVYAIGDLAWAVAYAIGPVIGGALMQSIGFERMVCIVAVICFLYAPLMIFLRCPPARAEKRTLIEDKSVLKDVSDNGVMQ